MRALSARRSLYVWVLLAGSGCSETGLSELGSGVDQARPSPWDDVNTRDVPRVAWPMVIYEGHREEDSGMGSTWGGSCGDSMSRLGQAFLTPPDQGYALAFVDPRGRILTRYPMPAGTSLRQQLRSDEEGRVLLQANYELPDSGELTRTNFLFDWREETWEPMISWELTFHTKELELLDLNVAPDLPVSERTSWFSMSFYPEDPERFFVVLWRWSNGPEERGWHHIDKVCVVHRPTGTTERCEPIVEHLSRDEALGFEVNGSSLRLSPAVKVQGEVVIPFTVERTHGESVFGMWSMEEGVVHAQGDPLPYDLQAFVGEGERLGLTTVPIQEGARLRFTPPLSLDQPEEEQITYLSRYSFYEEHDGLDLMPRCMHIASLIDAHAPTYLLRFDMIQEREYVGPNYTGGPGISRLMIHHRGRAIVDTTGLTEGLGPAVGPNGRPMYIQSVSPVPVAY